MTHFEQKTGIFDQKGVKKWSKKWPKMVIFGVTPKTPKLRKSRFCDFCAFRVKKCQLEPKNPKKPHSYAKKRGQKWPQNGSKNDPFLDPLYTGFRGQKRGKTAQNGSKKGSKKWPKNGPNDSLWPLFNLIRGPKSGQNRQKSGKSWFSSFSAKSDKNDISSKNGPSSIMDSSWKMTHDDPLASKMPKMPKNPKNPVFYDTEGSYLMVFSKITILAKIDDNRHVKVMVRAKMAFLAQKGQKWDTAQRVKLQG